MRIACVGLGSMGLPMALVLKRAGHEVVGHTRTPSRLSPADASEIVLAQSPAEAADACEVVITMLPDGPDVRQVLEGEHGLLAAAPRPRVWVDMSTIAPREAREYAGLAAAAGYRCLDAPVSGGVAAAQSGTLSIMVGGPFQVYEESLPVLETLGRSVTYIGDAGAGQVAKACNQLIVAANLLSVAEALVLAQQAGVDAARVRQALLGGFAFSRVLEVHGQRMLDHEFAGGFRIRLHQKDLGIVTRLGAEVGASVATASIAASVMNAAVANGLGDADHASVAAVIELLASTRLTGLKGVA